MNAEIEKATIFADEDAAITVNKFARDNIYPYTVSLDEPDLDIWLTHKQAVGLLQALMHLLPDDVRCPLCDAPLEEVVGVMGDKTAVGVRCPKGCDLEEAYL